MKNNFIALIFAIFVLQFSGIAQPVNPPKDWYLRDNEGDSINGINVYKAYKWLNGRLPKKEVVVAVIDGGTDWKHEDLKDNVWINTNEIAGNSIDDDKNGYVDDIYGWNFIGGKNGDVDKDNLEIIRTIKKYKSKYEGKVIDEKLLTAEDKKTYEWYKKSVAIKTKSLQTKKPQLDFYKKLKDDYKSFFQDLGRDSISAEELEKRELDKDLSFFKVALLKALKEGKNMAAIKKDIADNYKDLKDYFDFTMNEDYDSRLIVGDNYEDVSEKYYGNANVIGPGAKHGTAVAGCIAANQGNKIGQFGIANCAKIMVLRVVPDGDERDKDIANAIRYATDNGAQIINMSFGKDISDHKEIIDEAMAYAHTRDILLVHAAGNSSRDIDIDIHYPSSRTASKNELIPNLITVGAHDKNHNPSRFTCYGKDQVDVFAPGTKIYCTFPNNEYGFINGTSFACPITAGAAALVRGYYPTLSAVQIKKVLIKSVKKIKGKVDLPGQKGRFIKFKKLCRSGGIIDLEKALKLADKYAR